MESLALAAQAKTCHDCFVYDLIIKGEGSEFPVPSVNEKSELLRICDIRVLSSLSFSIEQE